MKRLAVLALTLALALCLAACGGGGGWPMTVFATPDGRPFFCGTYFPPRSMPRT